uniref:Uncharacterized protein n=1 Tax=Arundo donax TaxID=35708 RepID=A0A0A9A9E4_ARUDO
MRLISSIFDMDHSIQLSDSTLDLTSIHLRADTNSWNRSSPPLHFQLPSIPPGFDSCVYFRDFHPPAYTALSIAIPFSFLPVLFLPRFDLPQIHLHSPTSPPHSGPRRRLCSFVGCPPWVTSTAAPPSSSRRSPKRRPLLSLCSSICVAS